MNKNPPNIITQKEYWQDPVQVITGLTWLVIGIALGVIITLSFI